jgi:ubiquitin conjugation factor E4 B
MEHVGPEHLLAPRLLAEFETEAGLPRNFILEFIERFADDGLDQMLATTLDAVNVYARTQSLVSNFTAPNRVFALFADVKTTANMFHTLPSWNDDAFAAAELEQKSLLGPIFAFSAMSRTDACPP